MARRHTGRVIDFKAWLAIPSWSAAVSGTSTTINGILSFTGPGTILRARGFVQASLDATMQVGDEISMAWGLGIVSTDAAVAGATAMPDPGGDADYPWLWWEQMTLRSEETLQGFSWGLTAQRVDVDTKAMRKFKPGQTLLVINQVTSSSGAPVTNLDIGQIRVLIGT